MTDSLPRTKNRGYRNMLTEPIPIYHYVKEQLENRAVKAVVDEWRVENEVILEITINNYKSMGIYQVTPESEAHINRIFLKILKDSPDVTRLILEAKKRERHLAKNKRSNPE